MLWATQAVSDDIPPKAPTIFTDVTGSRFKPIAIFNDGISTTSLEVKRTTTGGTFSGIFVNTGSLLSVRGDTSPNIPVTLFDDGTNGDSVANDGVYTLSPITSTAATDEFDGLLHWDIFSSDFGQAKLGIVQSGTDFPIQTLGDDVDGFPVIASQFVVSIQDEAFVNGSSMIGPTDQNIGAITDKFYTFFDDVFDFLIVYSVLRTNDGQQFYIGLRNDVSGIGTSGGGSIFNVTSPVGIPPAMKNRGVLTGIMYLNDGTRSIYGALHQELMHRWGVFFGNELGFPFASHWGELLILEPRTRYIGNLVGALGGSFAVENPDNTITVLPPADVGDVPEYPAIELYLMGLVSSSEVPNVDFFKFLEPSNIILEKFTLTIGNIESTFDPRVPNVDNSQKNFAGAFIVVSPPGEQLTHAEIAVFSIAARHFGSNSAGDGSIRGKTTPSFASATGFRATMSTRVLPSSAFPSADLTDGKLVNVVGRGLATVDVPNISFFIVVRAGATVFSVDIFDGDQGGFGDLGTGPSFFTLVEDPLKDGTGTTLVAQQNNTFFADNAVTTLFSGAPTPTAQSPNGTFVYRLDITLGPDPANPDRNLATLNGFKVLASALVSIQFDAFQFIAADAAGPFISPSPFLSAGVDTNFDGVMAFQFQVPSVVSSFTLRDCDADRTDDEDTPGVAAGANSILIYEVFDPSALIFTNNNPSGNFDFVSGDMDCENQVISTGNVPGLYRWVWSNLFTENNIHVLPPTTSPAALEIFAGDTDPSLIEALASVSSARTMGFYRNRADLTGLLPLVLGELDGSGAPVGESEIVTTDAQARDVLGGFSGRKKRAERAVAKLKAQLLAAKLNIDRANAEFGEPLETARITGTELIVGDVVATADSLLASATDVSGLGKAEIEALKATQDLLDAVNNRDVTFVPLGIQ